MPDEYVYTPPALISLSNPDTVVTEERLYQFYQQILPYLGGMPDILANKFSKADLYSTDEKLIGRWIDGKPLYQKSYTVTADTVISSSTGVDVPGFTSLYMQDVQPAIDKLIDIHVSNNEFNNCVAFYPLRLNKTTGKFLQYDNTNVTYISYRFSPGSIITLQYTKTTDSAVEIGSDTDYSTTEKIVGTWIDGKPIWQKTLEISNPSNSWSPVTLSSLGIENSELVFKVGSATFITSTGDIIGEHCFGNTSFATCMVADNSSGSSSASHCLWFKWSTTSTMSKAIVTLQYTKTSS